MPARPSLSPFIFPLGLVATFLLVRVAALWYFWPDLSEDPDIYLALAQAMAAGEGLVDPGTGLPTAFRPPLYPMILTPFCQPDQALGRALLHLVLSCLTLGALWKLGKNLHLSKFQIGLASLIFTFDPLVIRYLALPMTETFCTCLMTILLMVMTRERRSWRSLFTIGIVFGLAVLSRPTFWLFGLICGPLWLIRAWFLRRTHPETFWRTSPAGATGCVLAGVALVVLPWVVRNALVMHSFVLMTTHGGYTLYLGNNEAFYREVVNQPWGTIWDGSRGPGQAAWITDVRQQAAQAGVSGEIALDRWMGEQARRVIQADPETFLKAALLKFRWFWNLGPQGPVAESLPPLVLWGVKGFYSLFWLAAGWGALRIILQRPRATLEEVRLFARNRGASAQIEDFACPVAWRRRLLLVFVASLMIPHLFYWSDARMRAPLIPALALIAASGITFSPRRSTPPAAQGC